MSFVSVEARRTRKVRQCDNCVGTIPVGWPYVRCVNNEHGHIDVFVSHLDCYDACVRVQRHSEWFVPLIDWIVEVGRPTAKSALPHHVFVRAKANVISMHGRPVRGA